MERRHFLKLAIGIAAGTAGLAAGAQAAPLSPRPPGGDEHLRPAHPDVHPAVTTEAEVEKLRPEQVRWGRHWHHHHWHRRWHWHRRHWGWHHRHWR
ncbi:MAG: twin-arginine translocation signal domain-containing protein [Bradyrhizobium sp.]